MKYKVAKSKIPNADKGLFAKNKLDRGERIGLAHRDGQPVGTIGNMHNHSDNPNMRSIKVGNERYVYAIKDIEPGEELTTDYRMQPELEQPEDFMRKGGAKKGLVQMPKPSKKGLASKKYSRSLDATNRLFTENRLFKKPKSKKNKVFDPNAKYYQDGGGKGDSPFKIKPNLYTFSQGPDSQVIGGRLDMSHKSGLHGNITAETPFMNKRTQPSSAQNIGLRKKYKNLYGDATLSNFATPGKLINPSADVELGYERDLGKGFNANIGLRNTMTPGSYYNPSLSAGIKYGFEDGGFIVDLTEDEIKQYVDGGYIIEEVNDPSVPTLNRFIGGGSLEKLKPGGANKGCPPGTYWNGTKCTKLVTLKNDKKYIDGVAAWDMHVTNNEVRNLITPGYNDQIKDRLYSGKWGFDPESGALIRLDKIQPQSVTKLDDKTKASREKEKKQQEALRNKWESEDTYRQSIIDAGFDPATFGKAKGTNVITGEPIYASSKEEADRINQEAINQAAIEGHAAVVNNPVFKAAAYMTPVGMAIGAMEGAARLAPDVYDFAKDPSWSGAGQIVMDVAEATPFAKPIANTVKSAVKNTYKINPWAFKPDADAYYRMINTPEAAGLTSGSVDVGGYFNKGLPLDVKTAKAAPAGSIRSQHGYPGPYMIEHKGNNMESFLEFPEPELSFFKNSEDIPLSNQTKVYKEHWLKGYKEVPFEGSNGLPQQRRGGSTNDYIENVNVPSIATLNRFTNGGGPGDDLEKNLQEVTIYDPKTKKEQLKLFEQLRVAKEAYQNYTKQNKGKKWKLNAADPLGSSISDLKKQIQLYRDEFKKEKEETERELKRLESLKSKGVFKNNKDIQNLKLKDLDTTKGRMKILDAIRSSNLSGDEVAAIYKGYGLDVVDSNVKRGTGPNKDYSAIETKAAAMKDVPQFVDMVSNVATAIPLIGAAGAVGGAAGSVLNNPYVQGAGTAYAAGQVAAHPIDTATGIATTGVEVYDKLMGDEDNTNRFGDEYWQGLDDLANLAIVAYPGLKTMKAARDWLKTSEGFNFARKYIKPAKDFYKSGVKKFAKVADPLLKTNIPMAVSKPVAAVIDAATGSNKATAVVDKVGKALESMPTWAQPNVTNALRGYTLSVAAERGVEGAQEVQEGFSSGDKATFEKGIDNVVNAAASIGSVTPAYHANNITTPLTIMSSAENVIDDASQGELSLETGFNLARLINAMAGLPTTRSQVVPIDTKGFKGFNYLKPRHIRRHLRDDAAIPQQQKGGIVTTMSKAEIDDYIKRGYIVEELD